MCKLGAELLDFWAIIEEQVSLKLLRNYGQSVTLIAYYLAFFGVSACNPIGLPRRFCLLILLV